MTTGIDANRALKQWYAGSLEAAARQLMALPPDVRDDRYRGVNIREIGQQLLWHMEDYTGEMREAHETDQQIAKIPRWARRLARKLWGAEL